MQWGGKPFGSAISGNVTRFSGLADKNVHAPVGRVKSEDMGVVLNTLKSETLVRLYIMEKFDMGMVLNTLKSATLVRLDLLEKFDMWMLLNTMR